MGKTEELVSVIIPVYKVEKYLERCLQSILSQTYDNLEIILVEDGSPDRCGQICDIYGKKDNRIHVIHQENKGLSVARNKGLETAKGEYICFVDSDDYVNEQMIETFLHQMKQQDADLVIGDFMTFTGKYADSSVQKGHTVSCKQYNSTELLKNMHTIHDERYVVVWGKLYKRELFDKIRFPEGRKCEDIAIMYKIYDRVKKAVYIDEVFYYYCRENASSITHCMNANYYKDLFMALQEQIEYMKKNRIQFVPYVEKTYMYWLYDCYRNLHGVKSKKTLKTLHRHYRKLYRSSKSLKKEKFYTLFYYMPELYLLYRKLRYRK